MQKGSQRRIMTLARNYEHLLVFYDLEKKTAEKTKPAKVKWALFYGF